MPHFNSNTATRKSFFRTSIALPCLLLLMAFGLMAVVHRSHALSTARPATAQKAAAGLTDSSDVTGAPATGLEAKRAAKAAFARLPIAFTANEGQLDERVSFSARGSGYQLFLTQGEAVLSLNTLSARGEHDRATLPQGGELRTEDQAGSRAVLRMSLLGANPKSPVRGEARLGGNANYFIGAEREKWRTGVSMFEKVRYQDVYPGIDLLYYGNQQQLEYDFVVAPDADPGRIKLKFKGAREIYRDADGSLVLRTEGGDVRQQKPFIYQLVGGERREVSGRYLVEPGQVGFELGTYDRSEPLIIDPVLSYSSFLGGEANDQALAVAVDAEGNAYITGQTESATFPGTSPIQSAKGAVTDAYVLKINPAGTALVYATYLGGNGSDTGSSITVDAAGNAYVTGLTGSSSFPLTANALQPSRGGSIDGFVTKLNVAGNALVYSTYLGGNSADQGHGIGVDAAGNAYVTGRTDSNTFLGGIPMPKRGSGAYKTTDAGSNWGAINNGISDPNIDSIVVDPTNSATVYAAGTQGVFQSMDGGNFWRLMGQSSVSTAPVNALSVTVDPTAPWTLYAGTVGGIYKSVSAGNVWENSSIGLVNTANFVRSVLIDPSHTATLYAGTFNGTYKSTNGAASWTRMSNGMPSGTQVNRIVFAPANSNTLYAATSRGVYRSVDGAANWVAINNGLTINAAATLSVTAVAVDPLAQATMYATTQFGVYKTTDGGASWTQSSNGLSFTPPGSGVSFTLSLSSVVINRITPSTLYVGTTQGGVFKSTDGGANWAAINNGLLNVSVRDITIDSSVPDTIYVATASGSDIFVVKISQSGMAFEYLLYLGGEESDIGRGIAVDASGNAYLTGITSSFNFPTLNAAQPTNRGLSDAFVTKLSPDGTTLGSTYLGGNGSDQGFGIAVNADGNAYVTGSTSSVNFPIAGARATTYANGVDIFVAKFNAALSSLDYSVMHGGNFSDQGFGIAVDLAGNAYVTGITSSTDFPVVDAVQQSRGGGNDAFVLKLDPAGDVSYSTYLGGSNSDQGMGIATHYRGGAYIVGNTSSLNFPTVSPFRAAYAGGNSDGFLARIGSAADLSVSVVASREAVMVGNDLVYTVNVTNAGVSNATAVTVNSALTGNPNIVSATTTQGTCSSGSGNVSCSLGMMAMQATATVTIVVRPGVAGTLINTVSVSAAEFDSVLSNNTATHTAQVSTQPSIAGRVLGVNGEGLAGVTMTLGGAQTATTLTDARGYYQFVGLTAGGTYSVTPTKTGYTFTPLSQTLSDVRQDASANFSAEVCGYSLSLPNFSVGSAGGTGSVTVMANGTCPWTATSSVPWVTLTSGNDGRGNGVVTFSVAPTDAPRSALLTIAGRPFVIWQEFNSCAAPVFQQERSYSLAITPTQLITSDLNHDGKLDLVALQTLQGQNRVAVLLNNGVGGFGTPAYFPTGGNSRALAPADFNGDGHVDLVVTDLFSIQILFGNGAGVFSAPNNFTVGTHFHYLTRVGDFNRDGKADLAVTYKGEDNREVTSILLGNGNGTFGQPQGLYAGSVASVADLNNDGKLDLVIVNETDNVLVRLGDGAAGFAAATTSPLAGAANFLSVKDVNGDGNQDVISARAVLPGNGAGGFGAEIPIANLPTQNISWLVSEDFNNDAKPDLLVYVGTGLLVLTGDGTGNFGSPTTLASEESNSPIVADFNGDSRPDVAMVNYNPHTVSVLFNACQATGISISGRVTNADGIGLYRAYLRLSSPKIGTIVMHADDSGYYAFRNLSSDDDYILMPEVSPFFFTSRTINRPATDQVVNFTASSTTGGIRFRAANYQFSEGAGRASITITRVGGSSVAASVSVEVATVDDPASVPCNPAIRQTDGTPYPQGAAYARCDYATTIETVTFAAGDAEPKTVNIPLIDDGYAEGNETVQLRLANPTGTTLGDPGTATLTITDNDAPGAANPIFTSSFFVRMQYLDFLSREPEAGEPWTGVLDRCPNVNNEPTCDRILVSQSFFGSPEFRLKGFYAFIFYRVAFNRLPEYAEIIRDMRSVTGQTAAEVYQKRANFAAGFTARQEFHNLYNGLGDTAFVNTLLDRYGLQQIRTSDPQDPEGGAKVTLTRAGLIARLGTTGAQSLTRAQVLRAIVESDEVGTTEYNRAFVAMQYYGYLRRTPEEDGYQAWLRVINEDPNNIRIMVNGFMNSTEYKLRFGQL